MWTRCKCVKQVVGNFLSEYPNQNWVLLVILALMLVYALLN